jgi:hypothetical protein
MAYTINLTNGSVFAVIPDGTTNTSSSVTLIGKNYAGYGEFLDDNFLQMLENFASSSLSGNPTSSKLASPLIGQIWWDSTNNLMKVWAGSTWKVMTGSTASSTAPAVNLVTGDLWYDTVNAQLKVYNGASFSVVGPAFSSSQGTTGAIPLSINDTGGTPHLVTALYTNNNLVAIVSPDSTFIPQAPYATDFPRVFKGVTVYNSGVLSGNISNPGNLILASAGTDTVTITSSGIGITGTISASGNVTGANVFYGSGSVSGTGTISAATVSASANVQAGNLRTGGLVSATGNITGGNVLFGSGVVSGTGNITGGLISATTVSTSGNITGGNVLFGSGVVSGTGSITGGLISATVVSASGNISAAGNVSGSFFIGNGSQLSGLSSAVSVSKIENGTSKAEINASGGNLAVTIGATANVMVVTTNQVIVPNLSVTTNITTSSSLVGNIGSVANPFNVVHARATTAQYADLAERFAADDVYEAGTVVELGGINEITKSMQELSEDVFGVISTRAAYLMNGAAGDDNSHPPVAMTGRVPVRVVGQVQKGNRLVSAGNGLARAARLGEANSFNVIGRSLTSKDDLEEGTVEAIVTIK